MMRNYQKTQLMLDQEIVKAGGVKLQDLPGVELGNMAQEQGCILLFLWINFQRKPERLVGVNCIKTEISRLSLFDGIESLNKDIFNEYL